MRDGDKRGNWQSFVRLHAHIEMYAHVHAKAHEHVER